MERRREGVLQIWEEVVEARMFVVEARSAYWALRSAGQGKVM